mmetsp:Transcript_7234/g.30828  ORF Transcript_7234/g.30828 Transcript_7234/m.30828 type:complete len:464 (-) Transcript_7234:3308-4699(-)
MLVVQKQPPRRVRPGPGSREALGGDVGVAGEQNKRERVYKRVRRGVRGFVECDSQSLRLPPRGFRDAHPRGDRSERHLRKLHVHVSRERNLVKESPRPLVHLAETRELDNHLARRGLRRRGVFFGKRVFRSHRIRRRKRNAGGAEGPVGVRRPRAGVVHEREPSSVDALGEVLDVRAAHARDFLGDVQRLDQERARLVQVHRARVHCPKRLRRLNLLHRQTGVDVNHAVPLALDRAHAHAERGAARGDVAHPAQTQVARAARADARVARQLRVAHERVHGDAEVAHPFFAFSVSAAVVVSLAVLFARRNPRVRAEVRPRVDTLRARVERQLVRRARDVRGENRRVRAIDGGAFLLRRLEQLFGMTHEVLVQRSVEGDVHAQRAFASPPGSASLLRQRGRRAGEAQVKGRVQNADINAQLQSVGRGHGAKRPVEQSALGSAAVAGGVSPAVRAHGLEERRAVRV